MKLLPWSGFLLLAGSLVLAAPQPPHHVIVWVQAKNAQIAEGIEFDVQRGLADRQVASERFSKIFPSTTSLNADQTIAEMRRMAVDTLICLQPARNIQGLSHHPVSPAKTSATPLEQFLDQFAHGPPEGVQVDLEPSIKHSGLPRDLGIPARGPIPGNQGPSTERLSKVGVTVFNVATGESLWKGRYPVRADEDMPVAKYQKLIADNAVKTLTDAGLIPPSRR